MDYIPKHIISRIEQEYGISYHSYHIEKISDGLINHSFRLLSKENTKPNLFLQKINIDVFKHPNKLMQNIDVCTKALRMFNTKDSTSLQLLKTLDNKNYLIDKTNECWRIYYNLDHFIPLSEVINKENVYFAGMAIGNFISILSDISPKNIHTTIPDFHHLPKRLISLQKSIDLNQHDRLKHVAKEIEIVDKYRRILSDIQHKIDQNIIPSRITHNDTKLSNIMIDPTTKATCMIDLDTIMQGSLLFDFGDSVRSFITDKKEDELISGSTPLNHEYYSSFTDGFLKSSDATITEVEKKHLPLAGPLMTFIMGVRFLTDYLDGDVYYQLSYPKQNYNRAQAQLNLVDRLMHDFKLI